MWFAISRALIGLVMITTAFAFVAAGSSSGLSEVPDDLIPHDPIVIATNFEFTELNGVVSGTGSEDDPYVIEGWDINASDATGIEIRNTDAHFVIRNVFVHNGRWLPLINGYSPYENDGIVINYCQNVRIENIWSSLCIYGVRIEESRHVTVEGAEISDSITGIYVVDSSYIDLVDNEIRSCSASGISLSAAYQTTIEECRVEYCSQGLDISYYAERTWIVNNVLTFNGIGIAMDDCSESHATENLIAFNEKAGIRLTEASEQEISHNLIEGNGCGAYLVECLECVVFENDFVNNDMQAFEALGTGNLWYNETAESGNYWSDSPSSDPRLITTDISDEFPLSRETWEGDHVTEPAASDEEWCRSLEESFWMTPIYTGMWAYSSTMELITGPDDSLHVACIINGSLRYIVKSDDRWDAYVLDILSSTSGKPAIALDDDGYIHIAYVDPFYSSDIERAAVKHVTNAGGAFRIYQIGELEDYQWGVVSTTFDSNLNIHLIYQVDQQAAVQDTLPFVTMEHALRHATNEEGDLAAEDILPFGLTSYSSYTACIDLNNDLHVAYIAHWKAGNGSVNYSTNSQGHWTEEMIERLNADSDYYFYSWTEVQIMLDSQMSPRVVFSNASHYYYYANAEDYWGLLRYCSRSESGWSIVPIVADFRIGYVVDLALDSQDRAHILYFDEYNYDPMYATNSIGNGATWTIERLDTIGHAGQYGAIVTDDSDEVHMLFMSMSDSSGMGYTLAELIYATSEEPDTESSTIGLALKYVALGAIVSAILISAFLIRRWRL